MSNADTLEEFVKGFEGTHFGLQIGTEVYPAKIRTRELTRTGVLGLSYMATKTGGYLSKDVNWLTERDKLIRAYPDLGCIKVGQTVGYLKTRPLRQFKKGYVPSNAELYVPNAMQIKKAFPRFSASSTSKDVIWQVFNREYWHPTEAVRLINEGEGVGYPLNHDFGIYCTDHSENLMILYKNRDVGVCKDGKYQIFPAYKELVPQFKREIKVECSVCPQ